MPKMPATRAAIDRVRRMALALPGAMEKLSHGEPCFFVEKGKMFVAVDDHHHGADRLAIWCRALPEQQAAFVDAEPDHFFVPPYLGPSGWLGVRLDTGLDAAVVEYVVREAWRQAAP